MHFTNYLGRFVPYFSLSSFLSTLVAVHRVVLACPSAVARRREHVVGSGSAQGTVLWWRFANDADRATRVSGRFRKINEANGN